MKIMRKVYIHIGMHKTGSTSIQNTLYDQLDDTSFMYADFGSPNHSAGVVSVFSSQPERLISKLKTQNHNGLEAFNKNILSNFENQLSKSNKENFLISGEAINSLENAELIRFKEYLLKHFSDIKVVAYIRSPTSYIQSAFQQRVKNNLGKFALDRLYPNYKQHFIKFDRIFGQEHVELWKFSPDKFVNGDVVQDFCHKIGVNADNINTKRYNDSLTKEAVALLYTYNKIYPKNEETSRVYKTNRILLDTMRRMRGEKLKFCSHLTENILIKNSSDISWMENRLGDSLAEPDAGPDCNVSSESDLMTFHQQAINELLTHIDASSIPSNLNLDNPQGIARLMRILHRNAAHNRRKRDNADYE